MNHAATPAIKATPMRPPTTPPAIAPAFELPFEVEVEVDDEPDPDVVGVKVDWETLIDDVGTMEVVPVTSGESGREDKMNMFVCNRAEGSLSHLL